MNHIGRRLLRKLNQHRCFHTTEVKLIDPGSVEEVKIPVPWGHIAGKWWGNKTQSQILALHGALDNANSFDRLIPLLDVPGVLSIDLPGHGHSSNLPAGLLIKYPDYITSLRYLLKHCLNWNNVTFIAHSFGSTASFPYAALFPDDVDTMVNIECGRLMNAVEVEKTCTDLLETVEASLQPEPQPKGYSWDKTIKRMHKARSLAQMPLSISSCEIIAERGTKKIDNNYVLSFDNRLKYKTSARFTKSEFLLMAKQIRCKVLNIIGSRGLVSIQDNVFGGLAKINPEEFDFHLKVLEKSAKKFRNVVVEGSHHVHLEEPQKVSCIINDFLK